MKTSTTPSRALAIACGAGCVAGALTILLGETITKPSEWTIYHGVTALMMFVTISFMHLQTEAFRARHYFAALGFLALSVTGTALVVGQSVGRQATVADASMLSAEAVNQAIFDKKTELKKARARFDEASQYGDGEMKGERCGPRCRDWRLRATEVQAHIRQLETEIAALGPQRPVNPKAEKLAEMAAVFGLSRAKAMAAVTLFEPFLLCLLFEIGSIVSLGFAFRSPTVKSPLTVVKPDLTTDLSDTSGQTDYPALTASDVSNVVAFVRPSDEPDPTPPRRPRRWRRDEVFEDLTGKLGRGERFESQRQMAIKYGVPTSTLSDWFGQWMEEGAQIQRTQIGRRNMVMAG